MHFDLVLSGVGVLEAEEFVAHRCLYQLIDPREWEAVFQAGFIEVSEVDVNPPLAILLLHWDEIGEPVG